MQVDAAGGEFGFGFGGLALEGTILFVQEVLRQMRKLHIGPAVNVLSFGPRDESVEGRSVGFLSLLGPTAFVAQRLQKIFQ